MPHIKTPMKQLILIGILFLSISSCGQTKKTELEEILLDCLNQSYGEQQVDINNELDEHEAYLIESKSLESTTGQSYFDFYKQVVRLNDIPATLDYGRFENIYKLTPNQFYSIDCLEELKQLDSTTIANSKYNQMTVAVQKAASDEVSPSKIAKAITSVLSPSDFDTPYYRAVALLTIAYTANPDNGLERQLTHNDNEDYSAYQIMTVSTTDKNQITLNEKEVSQEELKIALSDFIKSNNSNHLIKFQADKGTSYDFYLQVQDTIKSVYNDLRDELANEKFGKTYNELNENEQKEIREIYPFRMEE
jgi:biopolymer transport protein ExbD